MPNVAQAILPGHDGVGSLQGRGQRPCHLADRSRRARTDIEGANPRTMLFARHDGCRGDIPDMHEIAPLPAVLEDRRGRTTAQSRNEDRRDARIRTTAPPAPALDVLLPHPGHPPPRPAPPLAAVALLPDLAAGVGLARIEW